MATALTPIAWQSLSGTAATVTFSSIPGTYRDLILVVTGTGTNNHAVYAQFNGDTATNYNNVQMIGDGSTASSSLQTSQTFVYAGRGNTTSVTTNIVHILDYSTTDKHKTVLSRANDSALYVMGITNRWASTAVITSMLIYPSLGSFNAGSTFALYGVSA
jgi:hypothetical protein